MGGVRVDQDVELRRWRGIAALARRTAHEDDLVDVVDEIVIQKFRRRAADGCVDGANGVEPETYMFPNAESMKDCGSPEMVTKFNRGPVGWMTVLPAGGFNMGKSLLWWFLYILVVNVFVAIVLLIRIAYVFSASELL